MLVEVLELVDVLVVVVDVDVVVVPVDVDVVVVLVLVLVVVVELEVDVLVVVVSANGTLEENDGLPDNVKLFPLEVESYKVVPDPSLHFAYNTNPVSFPANSL